MWEQLVSKGSKEGRGVRQTLLVKEAEEVSEEREEKREWEA
jgi:hypothetical protein